MLKVVSYSAAVILLLSAAFVCLGSPQLAMRLGLPMIFLGALVSFAAYYFA